MAVNYNDERFAKVEAEKNQQIQQTTNTYNEMVDKTDSYYQQQIDASKQWADKQTELQNQQTDLTINKINQQKEQAEKDYTKEQKGAYVDYSKQTNQYGVNAEQQAAQGLQGSGYSESARTSAYNTYQNRYMAARESFNKAVLNYDNSIKEAQLANSSTLAQIYYETLQKQLELSLQGFQYKNTLLLQKQQAINEMNDRYYSRYQNVLSQINTENALEFQKQQAAQAQANWEKEYALAKYNTYSSGRSSGGGSGGGSGGSGGSTSKQTLTEGSSSQKLSSKNDGQSGAIPTKKGSVTEMYGTGYYKAVNSARTLYNVARTNKRQAVETLLATYVAKNTLNEAGVNQIMKQIGATK